MVGRLASYGNRALIYSRTCVLKGQIYSLRQDEKYLHYRVSRSLLRTASPDKESKNEPDDPNGVKSAELVIRNYLNLEPNLTELYEKWSVADPNFKKRAPKFTGVRILKQDAWETIAGFICSSNNNIARISQMVCLGVKLPEDHPLITCRSPICASITDLMWGPCTIMLCMIFQAQMHFRALASSNICVS